MARKFYAIPPDVRKRVACGPPGCFEEAATPSPDRLRRSLSPPRGRGLWVGTLLTGEDGCLPGRARGRMTFMLCRNSIQ